MRLIRLRMENFLSHAMTDIEFGFPMSVAIVGPSGVGKSSIVDAIFYALTGRVLRRESQAVALANTVRSGAEFHRVELVVEHHGQEYAITREYHLRSENRRQVVVRARPAGATEWTTLGTRSTQENWNLTAQLFGMDGDVLQNSAVVGQMDAAEFHLMTPAERRNLLVSMLFGGRTLNRIAGRLSQSTRQLQAQVGDLAVRRAAAARDLLPKAESAAIDQELAALQQEIAGLETALRDHDIWKRYRAILSVIPPSVSLDGFEQAVQRYEGQHRPLLLSLPARVQAATESKTRELDALRRRYQQQQNELAAIPALEKQIAALPDIRKRIHNGTAWRDGRVAERSNLAQVLRVRVGGKACPTCGREITPDDQAHVHAHQKKARQRLAAIDKEIKKADARLADLRKQEAECLRAQERLQALRKLQSEQKRLMEQGQALKALLDDRRQFRQQVLEQSPIPVLIASPTYHRDLAAYTLLRRIQRQFPGFRLEEMAGLRETAKRFGREQHESYTVEKSSAEDYRKLSERVSHLRSTLATRTLHRDRHLSALAEVREIDQQMTDLRQQLEVDELLIRALSPTDGAPAIALEEALSELNQLASRLIRSLSPNFQGIELVTRRITQSGSEQTTLDVVVTKNHGVIPFGMLSGGEQIMVAFTLRAAMTTHILRGRDIQFLILDESLSSLDLSLRPKVLDMVDSLGIQQVIVITHLDDVASRFPSILSVSKNNDCSQVEWIGAVAGLVHS